MAGYINSNRREVIYWAAAMQQYFNNQKEHYSKKSLTWLNSITISLDNFLQVELKGAEQNEMRAILNLIKRVTPKLIVDSLVTEDTQAIKVNRDMVFDFAEYALEYCVNCKENPAECKLRKLALGLGVPPYVESGPCQYWRKEI